MAKPYKRGEIYWIAPMVNGSQQCMSTKQGSYQVACDMLIDIEKRARDGETIAPKIGTLLTKELFEDYRVHYLSERSLDETDRHYKRAILTRLHHLIAFFGDIRAVKIDGPTIDRYKNKRRAEKAAHNTIKSELVYLRAAFKYAALNGKVAKVPPMSKMKWEDKPGQWFMTLPQFEHLLTVVPCHNLMKAILTVAYVTGWRITSLLSLEWHQVDLSENGSVQCRLSKNDKPCIWPLAYVPMLRAVLEERRAYTDEQERKLGRIIPNVFHAKGKPYKGYFVRWDRIRIAAGFPKFWIHDFRGTATVNLLRAGVDPVSVMNLVGFKTINMVQHYAKKRMSTTESLNEAGERLQRWYGTQSAVTSVVTTFRTTKTASGETK